MFQVPSEDLVVPDGFVILKITTGEYELYKIFGSWWHGDGYRMSSGSLEPKKDIFIEDEKVFWRQASGTLYQLTGDEGRTTGYTRSVLESLQEQFARMGCESEIVKLASLDSCLSM